MDKAVDKIPELIYDLLSIFVQGLYLKIAIYVFAQSLTLDQIIPFDLFFDSSVIAFILIYFFGQIVYSFSNMLMPPAFSFLFGSPLRLLLLSPSSQKPRHKRMNKFFLMGIPGQNEILQKSVEDRLKKLTRNANFSISEDINLTFEICRNYVMEKTIRRSVYITKEQAFGEMSRGVVFVSLIFMIALAIKTVLASVPYFWTKEILAFIIVVCFSYRYLQSRYILPYFIYALVTTLSEENDK